MKSMRSMLCIGALLLGAPLFAQIKPCEELRTEIETKLKDKGVTNFTLEIVPADQIKDQKVIGSCDGGKNRITYIKEAAAEKKEKGEKK